VKEGNKRGGDLGLVGHGRLDISTFEVSLGRQGIIGIKLQPRWKCGKREQVHTVKKLR